MTIGPVTNSHREISVTEPVSPALERVKTMLFKPFDLGKWFTIGFCAWLAFLGEGGGGGGVDSNFTSAFDNKVNVNNAGSAGDSLRHGYHQARDYVLNNLDWIVPATVAAVILLLALGLLILWLSSRGRFMFLHCVALDKAEVAEPWSKFEREANSLFWFRLVLGLIGMVLMLPLLGGIALMIVRMVLRGEPDVGGILLAAVLGLIFFATAIVFALINKFTEDFVVPILFLRGGKCLAAWKEFWGLLADNAGLVHALHPVSNRAGNGDWHHRLRRDYHHLLHRGLSDGDSLHRHGAVAAGAGVQAVVSALLPAAVRTGLRRVPACVPRPAGDGITVTAARRINSPFQD